MTLNIVSRLSQGHAHYALRNAFNAAVLRLVSSPCHPEDTKLF